MNIQLFIPLLFLLLLTACSPKQNDANEANPKSEIIHYYKIKNGAKDVSAYKTRISYYYDNGLPSRWIERDSTNTVLVDFIYQYNNQWIRTGAKYKEPGEDKYSLEQLVYSEDSMTVTTEWLDSTGTVYYRMVEELDSLKRVYSAAFKGEELHGYDTTYYTNEGFEKRIYFTNVRGKVMNDRTFEYQKLNEHGDWLTRHKFMGDSLNEIQLREINYENHTIGDSKKFFDGIISSSEWDENYMSFNASETIAFLTRGKDWDKQLGYTSKNVMGVWQEPEFLSILDTIYNGAISPSGNQILYSKRIPNNIEVWLVNKAEETWSEPLNLSKKTNIEGGYFNWYSEEEIYFYIPDNEGDLVLGRLQNDGLTITNKLDQFNTLKGCEFSPFMDKQKRFFLFTRYTDGQKDQQGIFISYNNGSASKPNWSKEVKIQGIPYGWGGFITNDLRSIIFTDGVDIFRYPLSELNIDI